jgi:hypothetical protein
MWESTKIAYAFLVDSYEQVLAILDGNSCVFCERSSLAVFLNLDSVEQVCTEFKQP